MSYEDEVVEEMLDHPALRILVSHYIRGNSSPQMLDAILESIKVTIIEDLKRKDREDRIA